MECFVDCTYAICTQYDCMWHDQTILHLICLLCKLICIRQIIFHVSWCKKIQQVFLFFFFIFPSYFLHLLAFLLLHWAYIIVAVEAKWKCSPKNERRREWKKKQRDETNIKWEKKRRLRRAKQFSFWMWNVWNLFEFDFHIYILHHVASFVAIHCFRWNLIHSFGAMNKLNKNRNKKKKITRIN